MELLTAYLAWSLVGGRLLGGATTLPLLEPTGFMPFQENYWLWKSVGFAGLLVFQSRWVVQWLHSEKHKESKVPISFWWLSLAGSVLCLLYFLRQQDSVGVAGYVFSVVPYTRNLMLIAAKKRADAAAGGGGFAVGGGKEAE